MIVILICILIYYIALVVYNGNLDDDINKKESKSSIHIHIPEIGESKRLTKEINEHNHKIGLSSIDRNF